ncbi:hypothetical protein D3878_02780 [Noviherbaspirillum sedimenti]|uniref:Uncharacterized protein n=1 Tax=Noviherbaspirillum sedimenti TaxID=2320865 RepID=A0A3A3FWN8_9BURK|nr:hypothetical protein D3878_02780 [Noviherbaspirillum sedimenti]
MRWIGAAKFLLQPQAELTEIVAGKQSGLAVEERQRGGPGTQRIRSGKTVQNVLNGSAFVHISPSLPP